MFDEVNGRFGGRSAARKVGFVFGSTAFQLGAVAAAIIAGRQLTVVAQEQAAVVKIIQPAAPSTPAPPAPPPSRKSVEQRPPQENARQPPAPTALLQPPDVTDEIPIDTSPREPALDAGPGDPRGIGVGPAAPAPASIEDAPAIAAAGFRRPAMAEPGCVQRSVRISTDLVDYVTGPVKVKFAITRDGTPTRFEVLSDVSDQRIASAIWQAVKGCRWNPGADAQGRPTSLWVIMPFRFRAE